MIEGLGVEGLGFRAVVLKGSSRLQVLQVNDNGYNSRGLYELQVFLGSQSTKIEFVSLRNEPFV